MARLDPEAAARHGRYSEKWRFEGDSVGARYLAREDIAHAVDREKGAEAAAHTLERILEQHARTQTRTMETIQTASARVPNVTPDDLIPAGGKWRTVVSCPWSRREHISVLEARAAVQLVRVGARYLDWAGHRVLGMQDSFAAILGASKGRSSKPGMCRALRALSAVLLRSDTDCRWRWWPSELNVADSPSRRGYAAQARKRQARSDRAYAGAAAKGGAPRRGPPSGGAACQAGVPETGSTRCGAAAPSAPAALAGGAAREMGSGGAVRHGPGAAPVRERTRSVEARRGESASAGEPRTATEASQEAGLPGARQDAARGDRSDGGDKAQLHAPPASAGELHVGG